MILADLGAETVVIDRAGAPTVADRDVAADGLNILGRGTQRIVLDLKDRDDHSTARRRARRADIVIEGFRPGVAERRGLGPTT